MFIPFRVYLIPSSTKLMSKPKSIALLVDSLSLIHHVVILDPAEAYMLDQLNETSRG